MKKALRNALLAALNSRFLNEAPCRYGFIGNVDAFSYVNLECEDKQQPGITVRTILEQADRFRSCSLGKGLTVLESDGTSHDATVWDVHELHQAFSKKDKDG